MRCLYCHQVFQPSASWAGFFYPITRKSFCDVCAHQLSRIENKVLCRLCGRELERLPEPLRSTIHLDLCTDCESWDTHSTVEVMNRSVYRYTPFVKEVIARFKFRGDACLAEGFQSPLREVYRRFFRGSIIIPIPLSRERLAVRFFNQAEVLAVQLPVPSIPLLIRSVHQEKQSKKTRMERMRMNENPFTINPDVKTRIEGRCVLVVDDIYTTGTTVRQAAAVLQTLQPKKICALTLARGEAADYLDLV